MRSIHLKFISVQRCVHTVVSTQYVINSKNTYHLHHHHYHHHHHHRLVVRWLTVYSYSYYYCHHHHHHHPRYLLYAREHRVAAILVLMCMVLTSLVPALTPLYLYVSTFRSMCAVPSMAVFCSSLTSWFPGMLLTYFRNDFEMVRIAPIVTGITFVFKFHMGCILLLLLLLLLLLYGPE
jgi:hypothetical protein